MTQIASSVRVPVSGVVTSWRTVQSAPGAVRLVRRRGTEKEVHELPDADTPIAAGTQETRAQLKVTEGDRIGLVFTGTFTATAPAPSGGSTTFDVGTTGDTLTEPVTLLFNATIEPDADRDGLGDETQDSCPTRFTYGCPAFTFEASAAPAVMPGATMTRTVRVTNTGRGSTETGTFVSIQGKGGITAALDGSACPQDGPSTRKLRCTVDAVAPGRTLTVQVTVPDVRGPQNTFSIGLDGPGRRYWPQDVRAFERFSAPVPELDDLRPTVRVGTRTRAGRLVVRVGCPAAGTMPCRASLGARLSGRGKRIARGALSVPRGGTRTVLLRLPRRVQDRVRAAPTRVSVTAVRRALPSGLLTVTASARVRSG